MERKNLIFGVSDPFQIVSKLIFIKEIFNWGSKVIRVFFRCCFTSPCHCDWSTKLAPSQPIRFKTKINRELVTRRHCSIAVTSEYSPLATKIDIFLLEDSNVFFLPLLLQAAAGGPRKVSWISLQWQIYASKTFNQCSLLYFICAYFGLEICLGTNLCLNFSRLVHLSPKASR